jgi:SAM-dependent methyltransferase
MSQKHYERIADLYDAFVTTDVDIPFFLEEARKAGGPILELMAGTGRLTIPLAQAGIPVTCVDFSPDMLSRLRAKVTGLPVEIHEMDIRTMDLGQQYPQIVIPFQAFPELTSEPDQRQALRRIYEHLAPHGTFICTLHNPVQRQKSIDGQLRLAGRVSHGENQLFIWLLQIHNPQTNVVQVLEFFEEYDPQGVLCTKRFSELEFHLMEKAAFERLIAAAGFQVANLYGNYDYSPFDETTSPFMIWVLQRT